MRIRCRVLWNTFIFVAVLTETLQDICSGNDEQIQCTKEETDLTLEILNRTSKHCKTLSVEYCSLVISILGHYTCLENLKLIGDIDGEYMSKDYPRPILDKLENVEMTSSNINIDFLEYTKKLKQLVVNNGNVGHISKYFDRWPELLSLDIGENNLSTIQNFSYHKLGKLKRLLLYSGNVSCIEAYAFYGLRNLEILELSSNSIEKVHEHTFTYLSELKILSLEENGIIYLPETVFNNNFLLERLRLRHNKLQSIPNMLFHYNTKLEQIWLSNNNLRNLSEHSFKGLTQLRELRLSSNLINSISVSLFDDLNNLEELSLSNNLLNSIDEHSFEKLTKLKKLYLNANLIIFIHKNAFVNLDQLVLLDLSENLWTTHYDMMDSMIVSPLQWLVSLEELYLNSNRLNITVGLQNLVHLKRLDLRNNSIESLSLADFNANMLNGPTIDLRFNQIKEINFNLQSPKTISSEKVHIILKENPIRCDCSNYNLVLYNNGYLDEYSNMFKIEQNGIKCDNSRYFLTLKPNDVICSVTKGCTDICTCSFKPYTSAVVVDCSRRNLTSYPEIKCDEIQLEYSQTKLILTGNKLTYGPPKNYLSKFHNLTQLDLSENFIVDINWMPPTLQKLDLRHNLMKTISGEMIDVFRNMEKLKRLRLSGNPWMCFCESFELQKYLKEKYTQVNIDEVICRDRNISIIDFNDILCDTLPLFPVVLSMALLFSIAIAVTVALYYRFEKYIKIYLFSKNLCLWLISEEEMDKDKIYDVFISYCNVDESFVINEILSELEHGENPFRVCVHMRDWVPGKLVNEQIMESVVNSRRTLVILSNEFLDSVWGMMEFRTAHTIAIREGRSRVIILKYGDLDESKVDNDLKNYMENNTFIKWGEKYFWDKLKYALPHINSGYYNKNILVR